MLSASLNKTFLSLSLVQNTLYSTIRFTLIGDDNANSYFQLNSLSGNLTVNSDLAADDVNSYTVSMVNYMLSMMIQKCLYCEYG